jgi:lysozyme
MNLLKQLLIKHEGYRLETYRDTMGLLTVGIGHLCLPADNLHDREIVSDIQIEKFFAVDIDKATKIAIALVPGLYGLDEIRQAVIISLAFNLGNRLAQFHDTLQAINKQEWTLAATHLQNSRWYSQVGHRGPELCEMLRSGVITN